MRRFIMTALALLLLAGMAGAAEGADKLEVHFLNVGRNDGILIRFGEETAFIDGGSYGQSRVILPYLAAQNVDHLDYYIATHAHTDHVGPAGAIFCAVETDEIFMNYELAIDAMLSEARSAEERQRIEEIPKTEVKMGDTFKIGEATLTCLGPESIVKFRLCTEPSENRNSLIFRLTYGEISFLFTGDATNEIIADMIKEDPTLMTCSVLKARHHNNGMHEEEYAVLNADYVIFSTSEKDPPSTWHINQCRRAGAQVMITSNNNAGDIVFTTDGQTLDYTCANQLGKWSLGYTKLTTRVGSTKSYVKNMKPSRMVETLSYFTSDPEIATVDPATGEITAVGVGECVITARAFDGSERTIKVTVKKKKK